MLKREGLGLFLVARDEDQIIGIAAISFAWTLEHGGKSAWLDELYVLPEYREKGTGSALIESAIDELKKEVVVSQKIKFCVSINSSCKFCVCICILFLVVVYWMPVSV